MSKPQVIFKHLENLNKTVSAAEKLLEIIEQYAPISLELHGGERACVSLDERQEVTDLRQAIEEVKKTREDLDADN